MMKRLLVIVIGLSTVLAACSGLNVQAGEPTAEPTSAPTDPVSMPSPTPAPLEMTGVQKAAIASLAQTLGVSASDIKIVSNEAVTWPNGCLGVQKLGVMCTQQIVPGFRFVLEAGGKQYELHTNLDGSVIVPAESALQAPGPAQDTAMKQLAQNLGIDPSGVKLVSSSAVEWPDSCLGVALPQVMCAQMVTPGYLIVLEAGGRQYEYHTNQDASSIMPGTLAMDWSLQGGIAGMCQYVTVFLSGEVYGMDCKGNGGGMTGVLKQGQREQLYKWIDTLANTTVDLSDPQGVSDRMTRTADLMGKGSQAATAGDKQAIFAFGQTLYKELYQNR